ncbi:hypothetical protein [Halarcobacter anaerophilus]|uniref:hypothetical protein n=1 Tax=Halarcobacter anaerophilus TaxID=877500 RepID=UPI000A590AE2|nr:hypothetical protein [Halarcobacter anaerophilus]
MENQVKNQKKAYIYALISVFLWSTVASVFKISLETLSVSQLVLFAILTSTIALFTIVVAKNLLNDVIQHFKKILNIYFF